MNILRYELINVLVSNGSIKTLNDLIKSVGQTRVAKVENDDEI